ncbi:adenylate/guanylate cyclase domain-containing protein [Sinosporangium siamense]|uniref:Adenylate cyclase n=1 Tax=Sinosporangium siamense TaxID=1367973 RepID=A0A919RC69_9ACTN|nr:adenylate/guanylate cyclase domain-containing protein [Sinosporangium siamense]GII90968.1 adenylate cyclase [Sinosporangium siamense]
MGGADEEGREAAQRVRRLLGGPPARHTRAQVAELSGVSPELAERIWRALGFASVAQGAVAFTDADVAALKRVRAMMQDDLFDEVAVIRMARALGRTTSRLAQWQAEIMMGALIAPGRHDGEAVDLDHVLDTSRRLLPDFEQVLIHVWRAQLAAAGTRLLTIVGPDDESAGPRRPVIAVGFADLVSFTQHARELDEYGLGELVEGFEGRAADVVAARGARLVKTLGDEVLFTAADPAVAAEVAFDLLEAVKEAGDGPDVRVGLAYGPVLPVMGDVFGTTVNLAARLTAIARPGTVLVDEPLAKAVEGTAGIEVHRIRRRPARGLGVVQPYVLRRT